MQPAAIATATAEQQPVVPARLHGSNVIAALKQARVEVVVSVPDLCTSDALLRPISADRAFRLVRVCKEDEGVSICAALSFCGVRAVLLIQQTGLLDSVNALRAIGVEYRNPVCMMVGLLGHASGDMPESSPRYGVRIVPAVLDALGIRRLVLRDDEDTPAVVSAIERAYERREPCAMLFASTMVPP